MEWIRASGTNSNVSENSQNQEAVDTQATLNSILVSIKKMLGLEDDYTVFDTDIIVLINAALMSLQQLDVGPKDGFMITDKSQTWDQFLTNDVKLEAAKMYVYLKVKTTFDPPSSSFVQTAYEKQIAELEWRLIAQAESVEDFDFIHDLDDKKKSRIEIDIQDENATLVQGPVVVNGSPESTPPDLASQIAQASNNYSVENENLQLFTPGLFGG